MDRLTWLSMLTNGNSELRADGIYTWTIPALAARLADGTTHLTCPNAGSCAQLCYARNGTYNFSNVKKAHARNLEMYLDDPHKWMIDMTEELKKKKFRPTGVARLLPYPDDHARRWLADGGKAVRIHDAGDFFTFEYLLRWIAIAEVTSDVMFYAYTKEVLMVKSYPELPLNFRIIYSMGGKQDSHIDKENDRHAEVFPDMESLVATGYTDQERSDLLAFLLPTNKIGIVVNNIPHFKKKQGQATFGQLQELRS